MRYYGARPVRVEAALAHRIRRLQKSRYIPKDGSTEKKNDEMFVAPAKRRKKNVNLPANHRAETLRHRGRTERACVHSCAMLLLFWQGSRCILLSGRVHG